MRIEGDMVGAKYSCFLHSCQACGGVISAFMSSMWRCGGTPRRSLIFTVRNWYIAPPFVWKNTSPGHRAFMHRSHEGDRTQNKRFSASSCCVQRPNCNHPRTSSTVFKTPVSRDFRVKASLEPGFPNTCNTRQLKTQ